MIRQPHLTAWCQAQAQEQLRLLKTLAAIPAPSHQEERRAAFILNWLRANGGTAAYIDPAGSVLLPLSCEGRRDITLYMAHLDVVFPDTTPLPVEEREGRLCAPGVGDDTANVVALMLCARYLLSHPEEVKAPLLLAFNTGEEGLGNLKGVRQLMADFSGRVKEVISFDLTWSTLVTRAVGSERWQVSAAAPGGHSYNAFGNPSAIAHLARLITLLYSQPVPTLPGQKTTYNVGTIQGGTSINTIPQTAELTYEYRSDDRDCLAQMRGQFFRLVDRCREEGMELTLRSLGERPCGGPVDQAAQTALLARCSQAVRAVTGTCPAPVSLSTDANLPLSLGIPATTVGLYQGALEHTRQEYVEISSLNTGLELALTLMTSAFA